MVFTHKRALQRTTPEQQGISSSALLQFVQAFDSQLQEPHSFMLLRHGAVVAEGWWSPYHPHLPHMLFSLSKSFTSTAVGLAVSEGRFSIDDPVLSFFPDDAPADVSEFLAAMRVRHLLSMSTGHAEETMPYMEKREDGNWVKGFLGAPVLYEPGSHFLYNTGATYMLSAIVQKTTGLKLLDYLQPRLFEPLGIEHPTWQESPQGINTGGFGLNTTTEAIARFGQMYLQKGMWENRRLIPEAWIAEATAFQVSNGSDPESDWNQGYGYQFWRCRHEAYRGDGAFGQYCIVMPEQDAVLAITSGLGDMQQPLNLVWDLLLPAMSDQPLPDDPAAHSELTQTLSHLALPLVKGMPSSSTVDQVSGQVYALDENELAIETLTFHFDHSVCRVVFKAQRGEETLACSYDSWQPGGVALFNLPWEREPYPVVVNGAWTDDATFKMLLRFNESPFFYAFSAHFAGETVALETRINVSFEPPRTVTLTGCQVRK